MRDEFRWVRASWLVGSLLTVACSSGPAASPTPRVVPEAPPPSSTAPATEVATATPTPTVVAEPAPTEADLHIPVIVLPEGFPRHATLAQFPAHVEPLEVEESEMDLHTPRFVHPDPQVRAALDEMVDGIVLAAAGQTFDDMLESDCEIGLANEHLVSAVCWLRGSGGRDGFDYGVLPISIAIDGTTLRRVQPAEVVLPSTNLDQAVHDACVAAARQQAADDPDYRDHPDEICVPDYVGVGFGTRGFSIVAAPLGGTPMRATLPYAQLVDQLVVASPLGAVLPIASQHDAVVTPDQLLDLRLARDCHVAWQLTDEMPLETALALFDRSTLAIEIGWQRGAGETVRLRHVGCFTTHEQLAIEQERVEVAAQRLGGVATRTEASGLGGDVWHGRVTDALNVRAEPGTGGALLRTLSPGTDIVVATGLVGQHYSAFAGRRSWLRVAASETVSGWVASNLVRMTGDCARPSFESFLAAIPEAARAEAARDVMRGASAPFSMRFAVARAPSLGRSWIGLFADGDCALATPTRVLEVADRVEEVRFVPISRAGTESVVAVATSRVAPSEPGFDGMVRWSLFAPGATTAGWSAEAPTHPALPAAARANVELGVRSGRDVWQIQITPHGGRPHRARWSGTAFVETGAP